MELSQREQTRQDQRALPSRATPCALQLWCLLYARHLTAFPNKTEKVGTLLGSCDTHRVSSAKTLLAAD